jgi:hypothetical protein
MACSISRRWVPLQFTEALASGFLSPRLLATSPARAAQAQESQLRPGQLIYAGAAPLAPGAYAIPCAADWNGDGRKDLLVGYQTAGRIPRYLKAGTDASPVFTSYGNLQARAADIVHPSGGTSTCWTNSCAEAQQFYQL